MFLFFLCFSIDLLFSGLSCFAFLREKVRGEEGEDGGRRMLWLAGCEDGAEEDGVGAEVRV